LKVRESADQSIIRLVLHSQGRPRIIRADGAVSSPGERETGEWSANETEIFTDSWINPTVTGFPSKRHSVIRRSMGSNTKVGKVARDESKKFKVAPNR